MTKLIYIPSPQILKVRKKNLEAKKIPAYLTGEMQKGHSHIKYQKLRPVKQQDYAITFPFPSPSEDEEMGDSVTVRVDSHVMKIVLHPGQDRQVRFENQHGKVHDRPIPQHYQ